MVQREAPADVLLSSSAHGGGGGGTGVAGMERRGSSFVGNRL